MFLPRRALHHRRMRTPRPSAQPSATTSSPFAVFRAIVRRAPAHGRGRLITVKTKAAGARGCRARVRSTAGAESAGHVASLAGGCARVFRVIDVCTGARSAAVARGHCLATQMSHGLVSGTSAPLSLRGPARRRPASAGRLGAALEHTSGRTWIVEHSWWRFSSLTLE